MLAFEASAEAGSAALGRSDDLLAAVRAAPVDREVREAGLVAEVVADHGAHAVQLLGLDGDDLAAAFAREVLALAAAQQSVDAGAVADVHVADDAELLERLEVAVDGRKVQLAAGDLLGGDQLAGLEERLEDEPARRREAAAGAPQRGRDVVDVAEGQRLAARRDRHGGNRMPLIQAPSACAPAVTYATDGQRERCATAGDPQVRVS